MDGDIHFGDLEETAPQRQLRPDQNRHFAVVPYGEPASEDLPIYVDIDVVREMEMHALSNTNVELGGVLLGGHYEDADGNPFVVITDSLRAEHYEATKGSFKFTHETWSDITRKRDEYPEDIQMVGWYHTHPGWGVFLSGMDTFICDNFFNKPLDVALVIDPCQAERAFFQWTPGPGPRSTRPTRGFFLTASRFRISELEIFAAQLEGKIAMPNDPRYSGLPGGYPPPVVQIAESRQTWLSIAVIGMLLMQFSVMALIAWRLFDPSWSQQATALDTRAAELKTERKLLDDIIGRLDIAPDGVVQTLQDQRQKTEQLQADKQGLYVYVEDLKKQQTKLEGTNARTAKSLKRATVNYEKYKELNTKNKESIAALKKRLKEYEDTEEEDDVSGLWAWVKLWKWYLTGGAMVLLVILAALFAIYGPPVDGELPAPHEMNDEPEEDEHDRP